MNFRLYRSTTPLRLVPYGQVIIRERPGFPRPMKGFAGKSEYLVISSRGRRW